MVTCLRYNVFETSSSSCHSLIVARYMIDEMLDSIPVDQDGNITISTSYFGRNTLDTTDALDKASYFVTWCYGYLRKRKKYLRILEDILKEQTGAKIITFIKSKDGGIYTEKWNTCNKVAKDPALLRAYIFNPRSRLVNEEC